MMQLLAHHTPQTDTETLAAVAVLLVLAGAVASRVVAWIVSRVRA